jgi:hypothetical protein
VATSLLESGRADPASGGDSTRKAGRPETETTHETDEDAIIAAIYARKSTEQIGLADESKSVTRQVEHARIYAQRKGGRWIRRSSTPTTGSAARFSAPAGLGSPGC